MTALYQIAGGIRELMLSLETDADGNDAAELPPDFADMLDRLEGEFRDKAESIALYTQELRREAEAADAEAKRLGAIAKARTNRMESLKGYLLNNMEATGQTKIETDLVRVRIQKNSRPSIAFAGAPTQIPTDYQRVSVVLDSGKAYDDWKAGVALPDGFVVEHGHHLRIS